MRYLYFKNNYNESHGLDLYDINAIKMEYVPDINVGKMTIITSVGLYSPTEAEEFGSRG